ncbi:MAG: teichoic acid biosynthesis protein [Fibrobacterota bacterium]|nr:MAG: teichoic acid biosynthesis protein [Fibrobacterota bacterium]
MATIFYSMSGEGRGHATRVKAIVEDLRERHRVVLFAPEQAFELLAPVFSGTDVGIHRLEGLNFRYRQDGRVDYPRSLVGSLVDLPRIFAQVESLRPKFLLERPDLVITDFDPVLPRAAETMGVPYASIDHQHFLTAFPLTELPAKLRWRAKAMAPFVHAFHRRQIMTIVSSFFAPLPGSRIAADVRAVGVLLGRDILSQVPRDEGFLLAYFRRAPSAKVLDALAASGREVRIYGAGRTGRAGNLEFMSVGRDGFVKDLAGCHALVATAGNQLVGEAFHLGKPVLALPESGNWEQEINGFQLERTGGGMSVPMQRLDAGRMGRFLELVDGFRLRIEGRESAGNPQVAQELEELIRRMAQPRNVRSVARSGAVGAVR